MWMDRLITCVSAGRISDLMSLMAYVSMLSRPKEVELLSPEKYQLKKIFVHAAGADMVVVEAI